jgi:hypothetical protein
MEQSNEFPQSKQGYEAPKLNPLNLKDVTSAGPDLGDDGFNSFLPS